MRDKQYPVMQFYKAIGRTDEEVMHGYTSHHQITLNEIPIIKIEIISCNNKSYINGKLSIDKHDLQFLPMKVFDGLVHTLQASDLGVYLSRLSRSLEYATTLDLNPESGDFSDSNRLKDWMEKSKLDYANAHRTKTGIVGLVNSFYNSFID